MQKIRGSQISMVFHDPMTGPKSNADDRRSNCWKHTPSSEMLKKGCLGSNERHAGPKWESSQSGRMIIRISFPVEWSKEWWLRWPWACNPSLLLADEPTSALDVTIQAQVLEMIKSLQDEFQTAMLLITHDLGVVAEVCSTVGIMYAGEIVEYSAVEEFFENTVHPYSQGLIAAIPRLDENVKRLNVIPGMMPDPMDLPSGCKFHTRCPYATELCKTCVPSMREVSPGHAVKCHMIDSHP